MVSGKLFLSLTFLLVLCGFGLCSAAEYNSTEGTTVYECGNITGAGTYTMNRSLVGVNVTGASRISGPVDICMNIKSSNVIFDCNNSYMLNSSFVGYGIYARAVVDPYYTNITVKNCNITLNATEGMGLYLYNVNSSYFLNNIFSGNLRSMDITSSNNNNFTDIISNSNYWEGIYLADSSNNTFYNVTSLGNTGKAFGCASSSNNTIRWSNLFGGGAEAAFYVSSGCTNTLVYDSVLNSSSTGKDVEVVAATGVQLVNCSYNISKEYINGGELVRRWYLTVNVTDQSGNQISASNVSLYDVSGVLQNTSLTGADGTKVITTTEYLFNDTGRLYYTNYSINVTKTGFATNSTSYNLTANVVVPVMMTENVGPTVLLMSPANNFNQTTNLTYFIANFSDAGIGLANTTLYVWNSTGNLINTTNITKTGAANQTNITYYLPYEGTFSWNYLAIDSLSNSAFNSTNYTVSYDKTAPVISLPEYTNATLKRNVENLTLNVSVSDAVLTAKICVININGTTTNQSYAVSGGWCNMSDINLTDLPDGNYTINVYVNDSVGNTGLNSSFVVQIDTTSATITSVSSGNPSTTSATITWTTNVNANSSVNYGTSSTVLGSNEHNHSFDTTHSIVLTGLTENTAYYYNITTCDLARNCNTTGPNSFATDATATTTTTAGSGATTSEWTLTYPTLTTNQFSSTGYSKELTAKARIGFKVGSSTHYLGIISVDNTKKTAKVSVSSTPQEKVMSIGEEWKVNVDGDKYYDVLVKLNNVSNGKANVTMVKTTEAIPAGSSSTTGAGLNESAGADVSGTNESGSGETESTLSPLRRNIIIVGIVVLVIAILTFFLLKKKK